MALIETCRLELIVGAAALVVVGACAADDEGEGQSGPAATSPTTEGSDASSSGSSGGSDTGSSSSGGSSSATGGVTMTGPPTASESDTDTDTGGASQCLGTAVALEEFELSFTTHNVLGEDRDTTFDEAEGACMTLDGSGFILQLSFGPQAGTEDESTLTITVQPGVGDYDLAVDAGVPGSGEPGDVRLNYGFFVEAEATTYSFDTANQAATGSLSVASIPAAPGETLQMQTAGEIAGGWMFDFSLQGTMP